jgi:hypothetical protein
VAFFTVFLTAVFFATAFFATAFFAAAFFAVAVLAAVVVVLVAVGVLAAGVAFVTAVLRTVVFLAVLTGGIATVIVAGGDGIVGTAGVAGGIGIAALSADENMPSAIAAAGMIVASIAAAMMSLPWEPIRVDCVGRTTSRSSTRAAGLRRRSDSRVLTRPARVLGVPLGVALGHRGQGAFRLVARRVRAETVVLGARFGGRFHASVAKAPVVRSTGSAAAHDITVHRKPPKRYRFRSKAIRLPYWM